LIDQERQFAIGEDAVVMQEVSEEMRRIDEDARA
jgi:hypothetical protein